MPLNFNSIGGKMLYNIPRETLKKMIKEAGAVRVSDNAATELGCILEDFAQDIGSTANTLAGHSGRQTVRAEDIRASVEMLGYPLHKDKKKEIKNV